MLGRGTEKEIERKQKKERQTERLKEIERRVEMRKLGNRKNKTANK